MIPTKKKIKPSRNSIIGYSYQMDVIFFLLSKMDVERQIDSLEIESIVQHQFDDAEISMSSERSIYCQMKDMKAIGLEDLEFNDTDQRNRKLPFTLASPM
ncbi:MAG: hypothetical protein WDZ35_06780 [Crocinitomicaceae bacterium]